MIKDLVKIVRISGEFLDDNGSCSEYITPYTGYDFNQWFLFEEGKKIFDALDFSCLTKQDKDILPEHKMTKSQMELNVVEHFELGDKPHIYLFSVEIPKDVWENKEVYAVEAGYSDDVNTFICDYTDYNWETEIDRIIEIPKKIFKKHHSIGYY